MDDIDLIRNFSRTYTHRLGLLSKSYLGSGLALSEARLLHDLDRAGPVKARELAQGLGLDEGQTSRILAGFARRGWIRRARDEADSRQRPLHLTEAGRAQLEVLRLASRTAIAEATAPLGAAGLAALARVLDQASDLLRPPQPPLLRGLLPGDAGQVIARHAALYARDEGYDQSFEALVAEILAAFLTRNDTTRERGWIAQSPGGRMLGSIFCMAEGPEAPQIARLRLFLIEPEARGTGLAQRMIEACLGFATAAGYRQMLLWTHESHQAAGRLYARNGFALVASSPARAFGREVIDQTWQRDLP
ncbi:GNAT family N-acetyltransferase [Tabrizicola fusiformis]|uniref:GNAT family N-acetyltransferase n=1 Tax=Tabrizicola sp. SY72 TaxID=2741673 RepID=UPI001573813C|nr:bifunctional helix-turn-helix transcriptional regulator/GNAT family N-acetyltransferase [Tabrizicola sp. SY72]